MDRLLHIILGAYCCTFLSACDSTTSTPPTPIAPVPTSWKDLSHKPTKITPNVEYIPFNEAKPEELIRKSIEFYQGLNDLQVDVAQGWRLLGVPASAKPKHEPTKRFSLLFQKPNQFAMRGPENVNLVNDGRRRLLYVPKFDKFSDIDAASDLEGLLDNSEVQAAYGNERPLLFDFLMPDAYERIMRDVVQVKYTGLARLNDTKVYRLKLIRAQSEVELMFSAVEHPFLLETARVEIPVASKKPVTKSRLTFLESYRNLIWDQKLISFAFRYTPPEGATRVSSLIWDLAPAEQTPSPLIGRLAPTFELPRLDGSKFNLVEKRNDSIVLLNFWSMRRGDATEQMRLVARVAEDYLDQQVEVVSVNQRDSESDVLSYLSQNAIDLPVAFDARGRSAYFYRITIYPTLVLIDKQGRVRSVHTGLPEELNQRLRAEIDALIQEDNLDAELLASINNDRSVSELVNALTVPDMRIRNKAVECLVVKGETAVPSLVDSLAARDAGIRLWSITALGQIGPKATDAAEDLIRMLEDRDANTRFAAADALGQMGPTVVGRLIELLKSGRYAQRIGAIHALGQHKAEAPLVIPPLIDALGDPLRQIRSAAVVALTGLGDAAIPALAEAMKQPQTEVYKAAGDVLSGMGEMAVPTLIQLLQDPAAHVRFTAAISLGQIGPDAQAALAELRAATQDSDSNVRFYALQALEFIQ